MTPRVALREALLLGAMFAFVWVVQLPAMGYPGGFNEAARQPNTIGSVPVARQSDGPAVATLEPRASLGLTASAQEGASQTALPRLSGGPGGPDEAASPAAAPSPSARPTAQPPPRPATQPSTAPSWTPPIADVQPSMPLRAAFYYPWFPETWRDPEDPFTRYSPSLGSYDSGDAGVVAAHIEAMVYGHIEVGIASWWGQGSLTDGRLPLLLAEAADAAFWWTVYYEQEGSTDPPAEQIASDLQYIAGNHGTQRRFLRINGHFVVFVYADGNDGCEMIDRWVAANRYQNAYIVLKVFPGYRDCQNQPHGWHQYAPARAADAQRGFSYTISPGFFKADEAAPRLERALDRWHQTIRDMIASEAPFELITTFNEWGEGTAVESAAEWQSASGYGLYLDALHVNGQPP